MDKADFTSLQKLQQDKRDTLVRVHRDDKQEPVFFPWNYFGQGYAIDNFKAFENRFQKQRKWMQRIEQGVGSTFVLGCILLAQKVHATAAVLTLATVAAGLYLGLVAVNCFWISALARPYPKHPLSISLTQSVMRRAALASSGAAKGWLVLAVVATFILHEILAYSHLEPTQRYLSVGLMALPCVGCPAYFIWLQHYVRRHPTDTSPRIPLEALAMLLMLIEALTFAALCRLVSI